MNNFVKFTKRNIFFLIESSSLEEAMDEAMRYARYEYGDIILFFEGKYHKAVMECCIGNNNIRHISWKWVK